MKWSDIFHDITAKHDFKAMHDLSEREYMTQIVCPDGKNIYQAFDLTPFEDIKAVVLDRNPYHGPNQAHGSIFSVQPNVKFPPSLRDMYQELEDDIGRHRTSPHLQDWAHKGVLLLNTVLTIHKSEAHSHKNIGWELLTGEVIKVISDYHGGAVSILWGKPTRQKIKLVDTAKHHIIKSVHSSPLSAYQDLFGSKPHSHTNNYLKSKDETPMQRYESGES